MVSPESQIKIKSLKLANAKVEKVNLLGNSAKMEWDQTENGLGVDLTGIDIKNSYVLEITLKSEDI